MSQEEQDSIVGRNLRERRDLKQRIAMLTAKANKQGSFLKSLGSLLENTPHCVAFTSASSGANDMTNARWFNAAEYPQFQDIVSIGNELRETLALLRIKDEEAKRLGILVSCL